MLRKQEHNIWRRNRPPWAVTDDWVAHAAAARHFERHGGDLKSD